MTRTARSSARRIPAERWFFPLAAAYASVSVPLSLQGMLGGAAWIPGLSSPLTHAHELLFGFGLAVVAGYLINRATRAQLWLLAGLWLAARALFLWLPGSVAALAANLGFAALLAALAAPQFLRAAKRWRNQVFGPLIIAFALAVAAYHLLPAWRAGLQTTTVYQAVLLFGLLMLLMGGRIIAPAVAGAIERAGGTLEARVQPRIEGALILVMLAALILAALPSGRLLAGALLLLAGPLAALRLLRWRPWRCTHRPDLLCLMLGYGWLAAGIVLLGLAWTFDTLHPGAAGHALTVGAMGVLTTTVMARVRLLRAKRDPAGEWSTPVIALAISAAAVLRVAWPASTTALWLAAALWGTAYLLLLSLFARVPAQGTP